MNMAGTEVNIISLYNELTKYGANGDYVRALKVANKVLNSFPQDEKAFHSKIICLLYLSRFEDALQAFNKSPNLSQNLIFEKAHCLYRLNMNQQALDTLNLTKDDSIKIKELKAQIYYRIERFDECYQLYTDILRNSSDEYDDERLTNLAAIIANLTLRGRDVEMPSFDFDSYELAYNYSCYLIFKGNYLEAEQKLKHAEKLCKEMCEESGDDDLEDDLAIIRLQLGFTYHKQGREKEAKTIYNAVLKQKPHDPGVVAVVSNNSVTVNKEQSLFESKKKIKCALLESAQKKLTSWQNKQIAVNNCLLNLRTGQVETAVDLCTQLKKNYPDVEWIAALVNATLSVKENNLEKAVTTLLECSKKYQEHKIVMMLTIAQLLIVDGRYDRACKILEELTESQHNPGIVSTLVSLYIEIGKRNEAASVLQRAVAWHQQNKEKSANLSQLWRNAAELNLRSGQPEVAARSLEEVLKSDPKNVITLAQLVISYSKFNAHKSKLYSDQLLKLVDTKPGIDIETFEATNWMIGSKAIRKAAKIDQSPRSPLVPNTPTKETRSLTKQDTRVKKKKNKLPKNYDPTSPPDPERWLPRYERSNYRKKKDRRSKEVGKGTQGAASLGSDQYDITKIASQKPSASPGENPKQQVRKTPVQSKKKKKGSKW